MSALDQILRGTSAKLTVITYVDGVETDADGDALSVQINDSNGNEIVATTPATSEAGTGEYSYTLAPQTDLLHLEITWTGDFSAVAHTFLTHAKIIGANMFTIAEARAFRGGKLADTQKYSTESIVDAREEVTQGFNQYSDIAFVPVANRHKLKGDGTESLWLPNSLVTTVTQLTEEDVVLVEDTDFEVYANGKIVKLEGVWSKTRGKRIVVDYEHGYARPPGEVVRAALIVAHQYLIGSDLMDRSLTHTDDTGVYRLSSADAGRRIVGGKVEVRDRPYGIPFVDAVLNRYRSEIIFA